jgi:uncharacterized tellurite resistance protein B-like protein
MLVILGTTAVTRTRGRGEFVCPECGVRRPYAHQRVQKRFALLYVTILPLDELGEYIECQHCRGTFKTEVLNDPAVRGPAPGSTRRRFDAEFRPAILRIMILMMMVDGRIELSEKRMIIDLNHRLTGRTLTMEEVDVHLEAVRAAGKSAVDHARSVAPLLNDLGKELVLKAAFSVAVADRRIHGSERDLLTGIGRALGMSSAHVRAVVAESTAAAANLLAPSTPPPL